MFAILLKALALRPLVDAAGAHGRMTPISAHRPAASLTGVKGERQSITRERSVTREHREIRAGRDDDRAGRG
jgi:hypothetical protein